MNQENSYSKNKIFVALLIGSITSSLLQTSLTTALPKIMNDFRINASTGQWLTSGFTLAMGITIPLSPFLLRRFKTKIVSIGIVLTMIVGIILALIAQTFPLLLMGRIIQGFSTGVLLSLVQVVILTIYPANKSGTMMGIYGLAACSAPVIAPTLTGILIDLISWRAIFVIGLVLILIDIIIIFVVMENVLPNEYQAFDSISMILCSIGFTGVLYGIGNIGSSSFGSIGVGAPLIIGLLALIIFTLKQVRMNQPFLEMRIFKNNVFKWSVIMSCLTYSTLIASSTIFPMYLQIVHGFSATLCGMVMIPGSIISAVINPLSGRIYDQFGMRKLVITGSGLSAVSFLLMMFLNASTSITSIVLMFSIQMIGIGCLMMPLVTWGMSDLDEKTISDGTATLTMLRTISGAIGSALFVAIMTYVTQLQQSSSSVSINENGVRFAYVGMFIVALIQLALSYIFVDKKAID